MTDETQTLNTRLLESKELFSKLEHQHRHVMLCSEETVERASLGCIHMMERALHVKSNHFVLECNLGAKRSFFPYKVIKFMKLYDPCERFIVHESDSYIELENGSEIYFGSVFTKEDLLKIRGLNCLTIRVLNCTLTPWETELGINILHYIDAHLANGCGRIAEESGLRPLGIYDCDPVILKHWTYTIFTTGYTPDGYSVCGLDQYVSLPIGYLATP